VLQNNLQSEDPAVFSSRLFTAAARLICVRCVVVAFHCFASHLARRHLLLRVTITPGTSTDTQPNHPTTKNLASSRLEGKYSIDWPSTQVSNTAAVTHEPIHDERPSSIS